MPTIKAAKDFARKKAVEYISKKYSRSENWGYMIARKDPKAQDGIYYKDALKDYNEKYEELKPLYS